jgi:hypothetical protein
LALVVVVSNNAYHTEHSSRVRNLAHSLDLSTCCVAASRDRGRRGCGPHLRFTADDLASLESHTASQESKSGTPVAHAAAVEG